MISPEDITEQLRITTNFVGNDNDIVTFLTVKSIVFPENQKEHLLYENVYTSLSVFCGKASFISKQPENSSQREDVYKLLGRSTQSCPFVKVRVRSLTNSCWSPNTQLKLFSLKQKCSLEDVHCVCYPNMFSFLERLSEPVYWEICLIIKINIYTENTVILVAFFTFYKEPQRFPSHFEQSSW